MVVCVVWDVECGMWNAECGMWNVECGPMSMRVQHVICRMSCFMFHVSMYHSNISRNCVNAMKGLTVNGVSFPKNRGKGF